MACQSEGMELLRTIVAPEWTDYNGHMNVAYYHLVFDRATEKLLESIGLGEDYLRRESGSVFALEDRLTYKRELLEGDPLRVTFQLIDFDHKRVHYFLRMFHEAKSYVAATCEHLSTFVDMTERRSAPLPDPVRDALSRLFDEHRHRERPREIEAPIGIRR